MPNNLNLYDPLFYANEALIAIQRNLGMAGRIHRGYEKSAQERGSTIQINKPSTFVAQDAPSTDQDLTPGAVSIQLNKWREVKFGLTDKELSFTGEQIINDHIEPAAYALALDVDTNLALLYRDIPWSVTLTSPAAVADLTNARKVLFNNGVPMQPGALFGMVDGTLEMELLNLSAFTQHQGAGETGVDSQVNGFIGRKFGIDWFANQNVQTHTAGVAADATGTLTGAHAAGATTISAAAMTIAGTFKAGDTLVIAGNAQRYAITADITLDGAGAHTAIPITPPLVQAYSNGAVVTVTLQSGVQNIAAHRNAFALATAPLSTMGAELGARVASVADPVTNLSIRSRVFYMPDISKVKVALDILYGFKTLDPNLAVRLVD